MTFEEAMDKFIKPKGLIFEEQTALLQLFYNSGYKAGMDIVNRERVRDCKVYTDAASDTLEAWNRMVAVTEILSQLYIAKLEGKSNAEGREE